MAAVPPIRRRKRNQDDSDLARKISFELDPRVQGELKPHRIGNGTEILVYMKSKRTGKPEKPCCVYCHRAFMLAPEKPLTTTRIKELEKRSAKTIDRSRSFMREAIEKLRRTDELKRQPPKTDEEYMEAIFEALKKSA